MSRVADINVEPAVPIDIRHDHAGAPLLFGGGEACSCRDVFELPVAFVEVEFITPHVGGEKNVGESVVIDISDGYAAAVIEVAIAENIEVGFVLYIIGKVDARIVHQLKEGWGSGLWVLAGGSQQEEDGEPFIDS